MAFLARWVLAAVATAFAFAAMAEPAQARRGAPQDWSHRHLVFSKPATPQEAIGAGTLEQWSRDYQDPRFGEALMRRLEAKDQPKVTVNALERPVTPSPPRNPLPPEEPPPPEEPAPPENPPTQPIVNQFVRPVAPPPRYTPVIPVPVMPVPEVHRDWSHVMGGASGVGSPRAFPAKYNFDVSAAPSCTDDFVVFPTASAGATGTGNFASRTGTVTGQPGAGTITITKGAVTLTLTRSTTQNTGLFFQTGTTNAIRATNIADAINRNGSTVGVRASAAAAVVTVTALTRGTGSNAITLTDGLTNFAWAGGTLTGGSGTAGQPTIFAVNQLYSSCGGTQTSEAPNTYWAYNTGTGGFVETSPVLSLDGDQVAFIQRDSTAANAARLVLLKWSDTVSVGTVGEPSAPTNVTAAAYRACTAPCMTVLTLSGTATNTISSPFYSYNLDTLYVGDTQGRVHKFTGVFAGTPAESGAPWPVTVAAAQALSSPVFDETSGLVFVGSARGTGTAGGRLHSINATTGAVASSNQIAGLIGGAATLGITDAPIVDSTAKRVYAFVSADTSTGCGGNPCQAVVQFSMTASIAGLSGTRTPVGRAATTAPLMSGAFDDDYWTSANFASPTGFLYVCGSIAATALRPTLWRIPITNNTMGTAVVGPSLTSATNTADCSPLTEVANGAADYFYVSVPANGNDTNCTGACIYVYNMASATWNTGRTAVDGLAAPGGTSGIVIDNVSSVVGASQVYYMTRTSPGNAIQASQAGLN
jgi:hypothetical protein